MAAAAAPGEAIAARDALARSRENFETYMVDRLRGLGRVRYWSSEKYAAARGIVLDASFRPSGYDGSGLQELRRLAKKMRVNGETNALQLMITSTDDDGTVTEGWRTVVPLEGMFDVLWDTRAAFERERGQPPTAGELYSHVSNF